MKKLVVLLSISIILVTGCSVSKLSNTDITKNVDAILSEKNKLYNVNFEGYKYYVPKGLKILNKDSYNALFNDRFDNKYYLYVDIISYYHNVEKEYKENKDIFYSKKLSHNNKNGYLEINKEGNDYYIELMYNYVKIEVYASKSSLINVINNCCYLVKSVKYNDKVLDSLVGENVLSYKEEKFNIFDTKSNTSDNFLDIVKEYEPESEKEIPDDEKINIDIKDD